MSLLDLLRLPETANNKMLDSPETTELHQKIIQQKIFLKNLYIDFYKQIKQKIGADIESKVIIELGSGGGFLKNVIPNVITSDVIKSDGVDMNFSAYDMPFEKESVDAIVMMDVLHHMDNVRMFFKEAMRCLKAGGKIIMIEPANTFWGRFIYKNFHHEPFEPKSDWKFESLGPLSSANGAIPWIVFCRDRRQYEKEFPSLAVESVKFHTPLRYLISGGLSFRQLLPSFMYPIVSGVEWVLAPLNRFIGMFMTIELKKIG